MRYVLLVAVSFLPEFLFAQTTLLSIITTLTGTIGTFIKAGVAVALLVFIWGVVKTIIAMNSAGGGDKAIEEGRKHIIWGIVGLFVIVSVWGLVALLAQMFGVSISNPSQQTPVFSY